MLHSWLNLLLKPQENHQLEYYAFQASFQQFETSTIITLLVEKRTRRVFHTTWLNIYQLDPIRHRALHLPLEDIVSRYTECLYFMKGTSHGAEKAFTECMTPRKNSRSRIPTIWSLPSFLPGSFPTFLQVILYTATKYMLQNDTFSEKPLLTTCTVGCPLFSFNCHPCLFFFVALILL